MKRLTLVLLLLALAVHTAAAQSTIFVVRHAEKADAAGGDPKDPDLSPAGRARAQSLADTLKDAGVAAIYVSEYKRTQQTAEPLAKAAGIQPTVVPAKDLAGLLAKLKETNGSALIIGHSNTVPEIVKALGAGEPVKIEEADYDNLFIIVPGSPARLIRLHLPPAL